MSSDRRWIWGLVALGIGARVAAILVLGTHLVPRSTYEHGEIAANLLAGRGFRVEYLGAEGLTSQQAPVYPYFVAAAYALGGIGTPKALLILQMVQAVLGGWLVLETIRLARAVAPDSRRCWIAAGLIAAVHPTLVYAATHVQVALIATLLLIGTLARAYRASTTRLGAIVGLWRALLTLTDPILALVAPAAAWCMARSAGGWRRAAGPILAMTTVAAIVVAPWIARNYRVHGELVLVKSSFGYAFWQGNCAGSEGTDKVVRPSVGTAIDRASPGLRGANAALWKARHEAGCIDDIALDAADYRILRAVPEPERSRILFRRAVHDLKARPGRYRELCLRRLRYFFLFDETNPKTRSLVYRVGHLGLSALALIGLAMAPAAVRSRLGPTLLTVGLIAGFHALTIVSARFHIPIEPVLAVWAGAGLTREGNPGREASGEKSVPRRVPEPVAS